MATLSQIHLARTSAAAAAPALAKFSPRTATPSSCRARIPIRGSGIPTSPLLCKRNRVIAAATTKVSHESHESQQLQGLQGMTDEAVSKIGESGGLDLQSWLLPILAPAGFFLPTASPAHAVIIDEVEEMMRFPPEAWVNIYITAGVWLALYFLIIPLVIYNYLRLRWFKRNFLETYFQFMLVFVFFPGMLLLAPFINFRRLPNDGAEEP